MDRRSKREADRRAWNRVIGLAFVLVVGASGGLGVYAGGGTLVEIALVTGVGLAMGAGLVYYLSTLSMSDDRTDYEYRDR